MRWQAGRHSAWLPAHVGKLVDRVSTDFANVVAKGGLTPRRGRSTGQGSVVVCPRGHSQPRSPPPASSACCDVPSPADLPRTRTHAVMRLLKAAGAGKEDDEESEGAKQSQTRRSPPQNAVSYTHLTLPTKRIV